MKTYVSILVLKYTIQFITIRIQLKIIIQLSKKFSNRRILIFPLYLILPLVKLRLQNFDSTISTSLFSPDSSPLSDSSSSSEPSSEPHPDADSSSSPPSPSSASPPHRKILLIPKCHHFINNFPPKKGVFQFHKPIKWTP